MSFHWPISSLISSSSVFSHSSIQDFCFRKFAPRHSFWSYYKCVFPQLPPLLICSLYSWILSIEFGSCNLEPAYYLCCDREAAATVLGSHSFYCWHWNSDTSARICTHKMDFSFYTWPLFLHNLVPNLSIRWVCLLHRMWISSITLAVKEPGKQFVAISVIQDGIECSWNRDEQASLWNVLYHVLAVILDI